MQYNTTYKQWNNASTCDQKNSLENDYAMLHGEKKLLLNTHAKSPGSHSLAYKNSRTFQDPKTFFQDSIVAQQC